jgi:hypothetical protein
VAALAVVCLPAWTAAGAATAKVKPLPWAQRVVKAGELKGFRPSAKPSKPVAFKKFATTLMIPADRKAAYTAAGFKAGVYESLVGANAATSFGLSVAMRLGSTARAARFVTAANAADLAANDGRTRTSMTVSGIPGAKGYTFTGKTQAGLPFEAFTIRFSSGAFAYALTAGATASAPSWSEGLAAARALYKRVKGRPLPT